MRRRVLTGGGAAFLVAAAIIWWAVGHREGRLRSTADDRTAIRIVKRMPREPMKPASLSGRVTRASDGSAIAGAVVVLAEERPGWAETTPPLVVQSDRRGRWAASSVAPGIYALSVAAIGFVPHTRASILIAGGQPLAGVDVALDAGGALVEGTVTTEDHHPIANARVRASRAASAPWFIATSDADGRYQLSLAPGQYQLEVTHEDYRRAWQNLDTDGQPAAAFVLLPAGVVRGQVIARDTGQPVPDASVQALDGSDVSNARTGDDGTFVLRGLADGAISITARAPGYASVTPTTVQLDGGQHASETRVVVDPAFSIVGRVVAGDPARGVVGAVVRAERLDEPQLPTVGASDADGNFELVGMVPGQYLLAVERRGLLPERDVGVDVIDRDVTGVTIAMRRGATLAGRVDPPVAAQIGLARAGSSSFLDGDEDEASIAAAPTASDATGAFVLRDVPDGDFEVSAMAIDGSSGMVPVSVTLPGPDLTDLIVRLSPRASIAGHVIDTSGEPVAGIHVSETRVDASLANRLRRSGIRRGATTATDGSFEIVGLDNGIWQLTADDAKVDVEISDGADRTGVTITVETRDAQIRGNVLAVGGKPAAGANVQARREGGAQPSDQHIEPVRTDATGSFVIDELRAGTYALVVDGPRGDSTGEATGVRTGQSVTVVLAPLGSLAITVTHRGGPARAVQLSCDGPAGRAGLGAEADGTHTFTDVAQGDYRCEATSDDGSAKASAVVRGEPATLTMALEEHGSLSGVAVDVLTGQPVAGLVVMALGAGVETDASGRFVLERVPAGAGQLLIRPADQFGTGHDRHRYTVEAGQRIELGRIKVVPPRTGDAGTFGLWLQVRDDALIVTRVRRAGPAERAGIRAGDSIVSVDGQDVRAIGPERARRVLASEAVAAGRSVSLVLGSGAQATLTAVRW